MFATKELFLQVVFDFCISVILSNKKKMPSNNFISNVDKGDFKVNHEALVLGELSNVNRRLP